MYYSIIDHSRRLQKYAGRNTQFKIMMRRSYCEGSRRKKLLKTRKNRNGNMRQRGKEKL